MLINAGYRTGSVVEASYTGAYSGVVATISAADDAVEAQSETVTVVDYTDDPTELRLGGNIVSFTFSSGTITYTAPLLPNDDTLGVEVDVDSQTLSTTIAYSNTYNHTHTPAVIDDNSILPDSSFGTTELVELKVVTDASSSVLTVDWSGYDADNFASAVSDFVTAVSETVASTDVTMGYHITETGASGTFTRTLSVEAAAADTTPDAFSFTDVTGQPVSTVTESNIITITGVDAATDVAASITGGEYAVSTDDGATFGAYTSAATNVQLDDQIKVRVTTSANNSTGTSAAFTAGGVTDTFTATTEAEAASVLESTDLESASNVSSSNISQTHVLESQSLNTDSASSNTQISQTHSLSTENVEAIPTLSLPSFGDMIYALNSSDVESGTNVNTPLLFILSQLNARVSESLSETSNPMISQTHSILTNNVEALSLNSIPFFTGEVAPLNMDGIPVKESVVFSASKMPTSLKQGSYYALKFPVLTNGEAVVSVEDAKFSLYRSGAEVLTKSIVDTSLNFASSTFNVDLDDSETEGLAGLYNFEMWFVDMSGNNIHVRSGNINFEPTKVRFI